MVAITLTKEQSSVVASAGGPVIVRDTSGREVAVLMPTPESDDAPLTMSPEQLEQILERMQDDPSDALKTAEMLARIKSRVG